MQQFISKLVLTALLLGLAQCATKPPSATRNLSDKGVWEGKVQTTNPKTKHRQWANVNWVSDSDKDRFRVDVFAIMDVPVATFLKVGDEHHLWLFMEKKHYQSRNGKKLFHHLTKLPVDPGLFFELLGPMGLAKASGGAWKCRESAAGQHLCESYRLGTRLSVDNRESDRRHIQIVRQESHLQLRLSRSKVEFDEGAFRPVKASQFKTIIL